MVNHSGTGRPFYRVGGECHYSGIQSHQKNLKRKKGTFYIPWKYTEKYIRSLRQVNGFTHKTYNLTTVKQIS